MVKLEIGALHTSLLLISILQVTSEAAKAAAKALAEEDTNQVAGTAEVAAEDATAKKAAQCVPSLAKVEPHQLPVQIGDMVEVDRTQAKEGGLGQVVGFVDGKFNVKYITGGTEKCLSGAILSPAECASSVRRVHARRGKSNEAAVANPGGASKRNKQPPHEQAAKKCKAANENTIQPSDLHTVIEQNFAMNRAGTVEVLATALSTLIQRVEQQLKEQRDESDRAQNSYKKTIDSQAAEIVQLRQQLQSTGNQMNKQREEAARADLDSHFECYARALDVGNLSRIKEAGATIKEHANTCKEYDFGKRVS